MRKEDVLRTFYDAKRAVDLFREEFREFMTDETVNIDDRLSFLSERIGSDMLATEVFIPPWWNDYADLVEDVKQNDVRHYFNRHEDITIHDLEIFESFNDPELREFLEKVIIPSGIYKFTFDW